MKEENLDTKLLLQVHDELILEVPKEEVETVKSLVKDIMESVVEFDIPLIAEAGTAHSWAEAH